jgi:hypothetical protein
MCMHHRRMQTVCAAPLLAVLSLSIDTQRDLRDRTLFNVYTIKMYKPGDDLEAADRPEIADIPDIVLGLYYDRCTYSDSITIENNMCEKDSFCGFKDGENTPFAHTRVRGYVNGLKRATGEFRRLARA